MPINNRSSVTAVTSCLAVPYQVIRNQKVFHFKVRLDDIAFCVMAAGVQN